MIPTPSRSPGKSRQSSNDWHRLPPWTSVAHLPQAGHSQLSAGSKRPSLYGSAHPDQALVLGWILVLPWPLNAPAQEGKPGCQDDPPQAEAYSERKHSQEINKTHTSMRGEASSSSSDTKLRQEDRSDTYLSRFIPLNPHTYTLKKSLLQPTWSFIFPQTAHSFSFPGLCACSFLYLVQVSLLCVQLSSSQLTSHLL